MIGLGSYAFFWQNSDRSPAPLSLAQQLQRTRDLDVDLFQICDWLPLLAMSAAELRDARATADDLGIRLELGTKGIATDHLATFLELADVLGADVVRSMVFGPDSRPTLPEAERLLREIMPRFEDAGVTLALETYEQLSSAELVALVEAVGSDRLGICLDPANTVAALEHPRDVVERCAALTRNIHIKDFRFTRRGGWVGFTLEGAPLGEGLLDLEHLLATVRPADRGISTIVEHWLPWTDDYDTTARLENDWTAATLTALRSME
ncbi:MAG: sugar phosphate isomerase/epimerase family protein [Microbacteriaceae bacterium]